MAYDTKCYDLAEAFLEDEDSGVDTDAHRRELAQLIQTTIEDQLIYWRNHANEATYERQQEALMESGGGPTLMEQAQAAWKIKRGLR